MIGLEFICKVFKYEYKGLAEELGISQPTIQDWFKKRRNIPKARIDQLSAIFPMIKVEYFQKELLKSEEVDVQKLYFVHTNMTETNEVPVTDDNGEIVAWREESYGAHDGIIRYLDNEKEIVQIIERITELITEDTGERITINNFLDVLDRGNANQMEFLKELLLHLNNKQDSLFMEKYEDLGAYLRKCNVITD